MSNFYTFYARQGNRILLREKRKGTDTHNLVIKDYMPKLWVESKKDSEMKNLYGRPVEPIQFDSMSEASQHIKSYSGVEGYTLYGTKDFAHAFVCDRYGKVEYDQTMIRTFVIDIEVKAGYPDDKKVKIRKKE